MFYFYRERTGSTEIYRVLIPQDALPDVEARFGAPLRFDHRDGKLFHDIGIVVLIHDDAETEYVVACKNQFNDSELEVFYQQLEMLAGHHVHTGDGEPERGWFVQGALRN